MRVGVFQEMARRANRDALGLGELLIGPLLQHCQLVAAVAIWPTGIRWTNLLADCDWKFVMSCASSLTRSESV